MRLSLVPPPTRLPCWATTDAWSISPTLFTDMLTIAELDCARRGLG